MIEIDSTCDSCRLLRIMTFTINMPKNGLVWPTAAHARTH